MAILKILVIVPNPQNSVIFIDNKQYLAISTKHSVQGLKRSIEDMFKNLSTGKVNEVVGNISLFSTKPQKKCEIAKIEPFLFRKNVLYCSEF